MHVRHSLVTVSPTFRPTRRGRSAEHSVSASAITEVDGMGKRRSRVGALTLAAVGMTACQTTGQAGAIKKPAHSAPLTTTQPARTTTGSPCIATTDHPSHSRSTAASQAGVPYCNGGGGIDGPSQPTSGRQRVRLPASTA